MSAIDFPFMQEEDPGFMNVPVGPPRSLADVFATFVPPTPPDWDLSGQEVLATSPDGSEEQTDFIAEKKNFKKIKQGTQEKKNGDIRVSVAQYYCESLNESAEKTHVVFSPSRLQNPVSGGTCSAMAFEFADKYLQRRPTMSPEEIFDEISPAFENSTIKFRTRQAVFNTLHKDPKYPSNDFMRDKVGSMLNFYGRSITDSSEMFYMEGPSSEDTQKAQEKIKLFLNDYPEGVFVVRCILFDSNDKGEAYGHSTLLIREKDKSYFYDPNEGVYELPKEPEALVGIIKPMMQKWVIPYGRIYKIQ